MIVQSGNGYQLKSKDGSKNLSKPGMTKEEVIKRELQVQYFKMKGKKK